MVTQSKCARSFDRDFGTRHALLATMTALRNACAHRFSPETRAQGEDLAHDGIVTLIHRGEPAFVAHVGRELTSIEPIRGSPAMTSRCTCKVFGAGIDGCRHLWALLAWLEDRRLITVNSIAPGFDLVPRHPVSAPRSG